jgi:pyrroline-5-carboxylate reductase
MKDEVIAFLGGGNMAEALIRGLLAARLLPPQQVIVTDVRPERLDYLTRQFGIRALADNPAAAREADIVLLAVKPQQMIEVLKSIKSKISDSKLVISIAAGVPTARVERELGGKAHVVRVMPNTPALVGAGAAALCKGGYATNDDLETAEAILGAVGITVRTEERFLDAVTALSGSGPAYLFYVAEAMIQAGVEVGLTKEVAKKLAIQTVFGAGKLLKESGEDPAELRRKVTSPGGTTEAALKVMNERQLAGIFGEAIQAAARRSKELSGM